MRHSIRDTELGLWIYKAEDSNPDLITVWVVKKIIMIRFSCLDSIYRIAELWRCHLARRSRFTVGERKREGEEAKNAWKERPLTKRESQERTGSWEP